MDQSRRDQLIGKTVNDIFTLNSVMSFAVFIGLSQATQDTTSLENSDECNASPHVSKLLIMLEVMAFSCFISSSLFAKVVNQYLNLNIRRFRWTLLGVDGFIVWFILTAFLSLAGIGFLVASVFFLVQIKIGLLSCGSSAALISAVFILAVVGFGLLSYVVSTVRVIYGCIIDDADLFRVRDKTDDA